MTVVGAGDLLVTFTARNGHTTELAGLIFGRMLDMAVCRILSALYNITHAELVCYLWEYPLSTEYKTHKQII